MKDYIRILIAFFAVLVLIPCIGYLSDKTKETSAAETAEIKLLYEESGEIEELTMQEYIIGAVFAQMPADFEEEALKAQAVLASTYIRRRIESEAQSPTESLNGAYLSDDSTKYQAYFTPDQAKEAYGDDYDEAYKNISAVAEYAKNLTLCYDGEPILVAFHGISFGKTESALSIWGEDIPYLSSEDSSWDTELEECTYTLTLSEEQMKTLLEGEFTDTELSDEPGEWIGIAELTESGTVLKVNICGKLYEVSRLCELLCLPSAHFSVEYEDEEFTITTLGCGHLVGMSQYGANEMAEQGSTCEEILLHYFRGTVLVRE